MRKRKAIVLFVVLMVICTVVFYQQKIYYKVVTTFGYPNFNKVVIIDPGHGGEDPGKVGNHGEDEKHLNLKIAQKLRNFIEESGGIAILTRSEDKGLYSPEAGSLRQKKNEDLRNRRKIIQESQGDLMVSIHLNSFPSSKYYGSQTFYLKGDEESKILAEFVQEALRVTLDPDNHRQIKDSDSYYILKENGMPSILVEGGFLSNPKEEKLLNKDKYQDKVAWAIYTGIMKFYTYVESVSR
ncbi:N-acetylmuramoyl-L-alanine amidase CwlD [Irregularibacter muris]|uniref:N-acetylmuramoyl-L-alanine amidase CwlD n=1 Tax=Irregularibacter muris TaxID=1796619 RepID=A0AAE3HEH1_9FIRM|nr:N-acetylmuramoyl-L-alanine amidase CwlD [Irregularibacter muris]MCR1898631.1 N-acetylmuramoyl-L-alanine amidase CwlD [Irregularibacter muris]